MVHPIIIEKSAVMRDVPRMPRKEEYVGNMETKIVAPTNAASTRNALSLPYAREDFVRCILQR